MFGGSMRSHPLAAFPFVTRLGCLLFALPLFVGGCDSAAREDVAGLGAGILGGSADNRDSAVVAVLVHGRSAVATCTGTLIAPDLVLTASHCINEAALGFKVEKVEVGTSESVTKSARLKPILIATSARFQHPGFIWQTGANDLAVVVLAPHAQILPYLPYNRQSLESLGLEGTVARAVGYGHVEDTESSASGTKNEVEVTLAGVGPIEFTAGNLSGTQCHGDSGGPILGLVNGREVILGVARRTARVDGSCADGVRNTRVDKQLAFLDAHMKAVGMGIPENSSEAAGLNEEASLEATGCCFNGQFYRCESRAACTGGFDLDACTLACEDNACLDACSDRLANANGLTGACSRAAASDATCRTNVRSLNGLEGHDVGVSGSR